MNIIYLLMSLSVAYSNAETTKLLVNITNAVFKDEKIICYIHDTNNLEHILNKALLVSQKVVLSFEMDRLKNVTADVFCNGYILCISDLYKFENYFQNKNKHSFYFKPHRRMLLFFENRSKQRPVLQFITSLYAVDIITISNVRDSFEIGKKHFYEPTEATKNLLAYSVYKNETLLEWDYEKSFIFNKTKFEPYKWVPKFYLNNKQFVFKISLFDCPPFVKFTEDGKVEGTEYRIIETIVKDWPVEYHIPKGDLTAYGVWSLAWKQIESNLSDLAACSLWQGTSEGKNVDFTYPFRQTCVTFLVPKPQLLPEATFVFQPFQNSLWFVTSIIIFLISAGLFLLRIYHENIFRSYFDLFQVVHFHVLRLISVGSIKYFPSLRFSSVRLFLVFWIYYSLILTTYYQAGLTSNLTKPRYINLVNTLSDMVEKKVEWLAPTYYFQKHFRSSVSTTLTNLADLFVKGYIGDLKGKQALLVKTIANLYVCDIESLSQEKRKPLKVLGECFGQYYIGFVMQKNSPFTEIFNRYSYLYAEHELLKYWYKISAKEVKAQEILFRTYLHEEEVLIELSKLKGGFYLVGIAHFFSILVLILEILLNKYFV